MAANAWAFYDSFSEALGDGTIDLDTDSMKVALFLSTSNAQTVTQATFASLTNELVATGYTAGGEAVVLAGGAAAGWAQTGGTATLDIDDIVWTFSAGATFRVAVLYSVTATGNDLIAFSLLDNAPADIVIGSGNSFTLQINASGVLTLG
jgi:hypothetical protein